MILILLFLRYVSSSLKLRRLSSLERGVNRFGNSLSEFLTAVPTRPEAPVMRILRLVVGI